MVEKYPFAAVLAELGHAKALAAQGEAEVRSVALRFLKQHPGHPKSGDVRFAIIEPGGLSDRTLAHCRQHERDLEDARATVIAANAFLEFRRDDTRSAEVRRIRSSARTLLYRQQVFLARWSAEQGRPHAALARWRTARQEYADVPETATDKDWVDGVEKRVKTSPSFTEPPSCTLSSRSFPRRRSHDQTSQARFIGGKYQRRLLCARRRRRSGHGARDGRRADLVRGDGEPAFAASRRTAVWSSSISRVRRTGPS